MTNPDIEKKIEEFARLEGCEDITCGHCKVHSDWLRHALQEMYEMGVREGGKLVLSDFEIEEIRKEGAADMKKQILQFVRDMDTWHTSEDLKSIIITHITHIESQDINKE